MSYVQENLMPNEKVLYSARIHPAVFLPAGAIFLLSAALAAFAFLLDSRIKMADSVMGEGLFLLAVLCVVLSVISAL